MGRHIAGRNEQFQIVRMLLELGCKVEEMKESLFRVFYVISTNIASAAYIAILITTATEHDYSHAYLRYLHLTGFTLTLVSIALIGVLTRVFRKEEYESGS